MRIRKFWLVTKKGIALQKKCTAALAISVFCYELFPNTILLPFTRNRMDEIMKSKVGLKELPFEVQEYVRRAIDDMKFNEDQRKALSVHLTVLSDVETKGYINSIFGAVVKLPWMLWSHYPISDTLGEVSKKHPEAAKEYFEAVQWSDKAKLYLTAYQLAWTKHYQFLPQGIFNGTGVGFAYAVCYFLNTSKNRVTDNPGALSILNITVIALFYAGWMFATDKTNYDNDQEIIKEVCSLGPDYTEGALELYKKSQQHNKAIRVMSGFPGWVKYTNDGDIRSFRQYRVPLSERLAIAEQFVKNQQAENQQAENQPAENQPSSVKEEEKK